jgi:hypothetical protein
VWTELGSGVGEKWLALVLTPAFAFWGGGVVAWAWSRGWSDGWSELGDRLAGLSGAEQVALAIGAFVGVTVSGVAVQRATLPVLRVLEGYWPARLDGLRERLVAVRSRRVVRLRRERDELATKVEERRASVSEQHRHLALERQLRRVPVEPDEAAPVRRMPTALGNILRASESRPVDKYGLDTATCWPRLWLVLPETARNELTTARTALDSAATVVVWAVLFVVWTVFAWWALPAGLLVAAAAYRLVLGSAAVYGDLLESAFDVHRRLLYDAVAWPLPRTPAEERELGEALTEYLWRGSDDPTPPFRRADSGTA